MYVCVCVCVYACVCVCVFVCLCLFGCGMVVVYVFMRNGFFVRLFAQILFTEKVMQTQQNMGLQVMVQS